MSGAFGRLVGPRTRAPRRGTWARPHKTPDWSSVPDSTGSALRPRIDSRTATTAATFALPAAMTRALGLGTPAGRIRVVTPAGARQYKLTPARGRRPMGLSANAAGRPGVRIRGRTVVVTGLPARTGIVDVTVYQPRAPRGPALLARNRRATAVATIRAPGTKRIVARISRSGG